MSVTKKEKQQIEGRLRIGIGAGILGAGVSDLLLARHPEKKVPVLVGVAVALGLLTFAIKKLEKHD